MIADLTGNTSLHIAVTNGELDLARLLLENGADANARHLFGTTPLGLTSDPAMIRLLRQYGGR